MFLEIGAGLTIVALVLAFTVPKLGSRWFETIERRFGRLAEKRGLSVIVVGLTALALRAALLPILPIPVPSVHDEFGYLLLSDTFAHGRLTNPTNPMWVHFESFHIIWQPTYTAMFYPAQGLIMALGQVITGYPFWGVWLSVGLMCAAITWMLQGWLTPGWALLGGFLAVIRLGAFSYWDNSYWGGAMAALGGALVLGALPRLKKEQRVRYALLMGLGFAIVANSRPYEGLFLGIPVAGAILVWLWKMKRPELGRALKRALAPLLVVLGLTVIAMGYYFWRTTGSPLNTPYEVDVHTYNPVPYFPWQALRPFPVYRHSAFRTYYHQELLAQYRLSRTPAGLVKIWFRGVVVFWCFYLGFALGLPPLLAFVTLPYNFSWRSIESNSRFLLLVSGVLIAASMLPIYYEPHYTAPIACVIYALVLISMRRIRQSKWGGKPSGLFISRAVPSICVLLLVIRTAAGPLHLPLPVWPGEAVATWCAPGPSKTARSAVLAQLKQDPGRQLVIVHYSPDHNVDTNEWVYNRADLETAKVVWARDMGPAKNEELIQYFKHRRVWLVDADDHPPKLLAYSEATGTNLTTASSKAP